eukprot:TRINITY_DN3707_c0_g2_i1.p1 TRINITY_DN3707_c0_g2~~TRINITY_DN3707_c0_g2_i1.p1  ORF type:complete len:736 (+),score=103.82 TRINITY_DN3707_c0_g2_i1:44-2251(+)
MRRADDGQPKKSSKVLSCSIVPEAEYAGCSSQQRLNVSDIGRGSLHYGDVAAQQNSDPPSCRTEALYGGYRSQRHSLPEFASASGIAPGILPRSLYGEIAAQQCSDPLSCHAEALYGGYRSQRHSLPEFASASGIAPGILPRSRYGDIADQHCSDPSFPSQRSLRASLPVRPGWQLGASRQAPVVDACPLLSRLSAQCPPAPSASSSASLKHHAGYPVLSRPPVERLSVSPAPPPPPRRRCSSPPVRQAADATASRQLSEVQRRASSPEASAFGRRSAHSMSPRSHPCLHGDSPMRRSHDARSPRRSLSAERRPMWRKGLNLSCSSVIAEVAEPPTEAFIDVFLRIRPQNEREYASERCIFLEDEDAVVVDDGQSLHRFQFKGIIDSDADANSVWVDQSDQTEVYRMIGEEAAQSVLRGFNTCIFSMGQTGTGKSHTLIGTPDDPGLLPRLVNRVLEARQRCKLTCFEIHMDCIRDLLANATMKQNSSEMRSIPQKGAILSNLQSATVEDVHSAMKLLHAASRNRHTARTNMNAVSSRGHAIFQLEIVQGPKLCVVDLAGRENERSTACKGASLSELIYINKSLFHLTNVLQALARPKPGSVVPWRNSKLTMLLQEPMQESRTMMVATVSPASCSTDDTLATLRVAKAVAKITTRSRRRLAASCAGEPAETSRACCDTSRSSLASERSSQASTAVPTSRSSMSQCPASFSHKDWVPSAVQKGRRMPPGYTSRATI